jgi:flagellar L-ring protein precursor FlgH
MRPYAPLLAWSLAAGLAGAACGPATHIDAYVPKKRTYELPATAAAKTPEGKGSLWVDDRPSAVLFADARALHVNDVVVVRVEENADARRTTDMDIARDAANDANIAAFLSVFNDKKPSSKLKTWGDIVKGVDLNTTASTSFKNAGSTGRSEKLSATVPALVRQELPNGNLFIEGHRVVLVNSEEHHFYVSGVIRRFDIDGENSIKSSMIADAEIEFTGRGILSDNQRQGVVQRYFGWIWPF